jgi:hypothetical protein
MQDAQNSILKRRSSSRTLFEQVVVRKTAPLKGILEGVKKIEVEGGGR